MRNKLIFLLCFIACQAFALPADAPLSDPEQEARAKALFHKVRCVVCQGESIADSPAEIAGDLRRMIREQVAAGQQDDAIKSMLTSRYGDSILMNPPIRPSTLLLWFGPLAILAASLFAAWRYFKASE